jgi:ABC-type multidrug transport system fused ATPase/permease subunit
MGGIKETRVIGCEAYFENQLRAQTEKYASNATLGLSFSNLPRYTIEAFLITFLIAFTFLFNTTNQGTNQNLSSVLGIFALASIRLLPATSNIATSINGIRYTTYALDKIYSDLKELESVKAFDPDQTDNIYSQESNNNHRISFCDSVVIDNISYCYPNAQKLSLEKISIALEKGQSIGLIGRSGAGKTTLVDIILGLLTPQSGDIKVDDVSIYSNLRSWQNMIGYVPQSIFLIDDTLEKNIAFGVPDDLIDSERMTAAITAAQLSEVVEQLSEGLKTIVGERGVLLSGGQRQRVGIARALYHQREILVFDEATAALDNETEGLVTEAIKSLSGAKTMIIIAHRLSTIEHCDLIYMLENGCLVKSGKYHEVISSA